MTNLNALGEIEQFSINENIVTQLVNLGAVRAEHAYRSTVNPDITGVEPLIIVPGTDQNEGAFTTMVITPGRRFYASAGDGDSRVTALLHQGEGLNARWSDIMNQEPSTEAMGFPPQEWDARIMLNGQKVNIHMYHVNQERKADLSDLQKELQERVSKKQQTNRARNVTSNPFAVYRGK